MAKTATQIYSNTPLTSLAGTEKLVGDAGTGTGGATPGQTGGMTTQDIANLSGAPAVSIEFTTDADLTLTQAQYQAESITFTDSPTTLTTGRSVVFPAHFPTKWVKNNTAQTLTLKKSGQTGVAVVAGGTGIVASGVTDVVVGPGASAVTSINGLTGSVTLGGESIAEPVNALSSSSGTLTVNCANGDYFTYTFTENITAWTISNLPAANKAQTLMIRLTQHASAVKTMSWPASFKWSGGTPAVSAATSAVDVLALTTFDQGTTWYATLAKAFA